MPEHSFPVLCVFLRPLRSSKGAVLVAVAEVDEAADGAPDDEADPGLVGEVGHEVAAGEDGERGDDPDGGAAEGAVDVGLCHAQHEDAE